jgi:hypothetical protein
MAMEEIDDGEMGRARVEGGCGGAGGGLVGAEGCGMGGLDDDAFDVFFHGFAVDEDGVDACREGVSGEEEKGEEEVLHNRDV